MVENKKTPPPPKDMKNRVVKEGACDGIYIILVFIVIIGVTFMFTFGWDKWE